MSRRGSSRNAGNGAQLQRMGIMDPMAEVHQMMRGFGGIHDGFMRDMMMPFGRDPFEDMFKFSDIHKNMHENNREGSFVCQTYVSSSKMGPDGKIHREDYFENNMGQNKGGNTISQKQQAYKNNQGLNRIAEERMLNDRGRKVIKEKVGNNIEETNHYYNIDEEEVGQFDNDWRRVDGETKFLQNHQKHLRELGNAPRQMQLGYQPSSFEPTRQQRPVRQLPSESSNRGSQAGSNRDYQAGSSRNYQAGSNRDYQAGSNRDYQAGSNMNSQVGSSKAPSMGYSRR